MMRLLYLLLLGFWASGLMFSGCAPISPPGALADPEKPAPAKNPEAFVAAVRQEITQLEQNLPTAGTERVNALVQLCRAYYILGELAKAGKNENFAKGQRYAELILKDNPQWADGHYWRALNQASQAEHCGAGKALRMLPGIMEEMERAANIDPTYDQAGAHRVLGRIYCEAPGWPLSVGDINKSLHHLSLAAQIAPKNSTNQLFLAETLLKLEKTAEARKVLEATLAAREHAIWPRGIEEDHGKARYHLEKLSKRAAYKGHAPPP